MDKQVLITQVKAILQGFPDLSTVTERSIRQQLLEKNPELNLETHKEILKTTIRDTFLNVVEERERIAKQNDTEDDDFDNYENVNVKDDELSELEDEGGRPRPSKKRAKKHKANDGTIEDRELALALSQELNGRTRRSTGTVAKTKSAPRKKKPKKEDGEKRAAPRNAFNAPMILSPVLGSLLGEKELSRPQVVKQLWVYIKEHGLQDPGDRRYIQCDDKLRGVFQVDRIHMMTMNKALTPHLFKSEDILPQRKGVDERVKSEDAQDSD